MHAAPTHASSPAPTLPSWDAPRVIIELEQAGRTLLALPHAGPSPGLRQARWDILRTAIEAYGWSGQALAAPTPSAARISRMDATLGWISLIPQENYVLRRIVGARALVNPLTDRHVFPWRRLAAAIGADHKAVQRWHAQGIGLIAAALNRRDSPPARAPAPARRPGS